MNDLNYVLLAGNVVRKPNLHVINEKASVCNFTIAVNRNYLDKRKNKWVSVPSFFRIETWGNVAEACAKYLDKGRGVRIVGRLHQSSWHGYGDEYRDRIYVISEHVEFQPLKKNEEAKIAVPDGDDMQKTDSVETQEQIDEDFMVQQEIEDDEIIPEEPEE